MLVSGGFEQLTFRTILGRLGRMSFSRGRELQLASLLRTAKKPPSVAEIRQILNTQKGDAVVLLSPQNLPADLEHLFAEAEKIGQKGDETETGELVQLGCNFPRP